MDLRSVMIEAAQVLTQITGLNVYAYPPMSLTPPAGFVSYPQQVIYDQTYGRGVDRYEGLPLSLYARWSDEAAARDAVTEWCEGTGAMSVKAHMEAHTWQSCDDFTVTGCTFDVEKINNIDYLVVIFTADIMGGGV